VWCGLGDFNGDLVDMMVAGSAAAGQAIALAKSLRSKAIPEPARVLDRSGEIRLGVFLCTCNGTMASPSVLTRILELANERTGSRPWGDRLFRVPPARFRPHRAAAVKKHRLNRVILASCAVVLEFQCISCNDQRGPDPHPSLR